MDMDVYDWDTRSQNIYTRSVTLILTLALTGYDPGPLTLTLPPTLAV